MFKRQLSRIVPYMSCNYRIKGRFHKDLPSWIDIYGPEWYKNIKITAILTITRRSQISKNVDSASESSLQLQIIKENSFVRVEIFVSLSGFSLCGLLFSVGFVTTLYSIQNFFVKMLNELFVSIQQLVPYFSKVMSGVIRFGKSPDILISCSYLSKNEIIVNTCS